MFFLGRVMNFIQGYPSGGNLGIYDAVTALQWVRNNIGFFGGDNTRVTIWGQGSGGMSAGLLMLSPLTDGLISSVIMDSAPLVMAAQPCSYTEAATLRWASQTRCASGDWNTDCLQSLTPKEVYTAVRSSGQTTLLGASDWTNNFSPCVDGTLISAPPLALMLQGKYKKVPVLAGFASNEAFIFTDKWKKNISSYTDEFFERFISKCERGFAFSQRSCCNTAQLQIR
jgi:hypothetical protein